MSKKDLDLIVELRKEQDRLNFFKSVFILPGVMLLASLIARLIVGI